LIIGHHPHVVQETAVVDGAFVAYSLGNFLFDQDEGATGQGLALRILLDNAGLAGVQALPVRSGLRPRLMSPAEAESLLARLIPPPTRIAYACDEQGCIKTAAAGETKGGLFVGGEIDLTGDGVAEEIKRDGEQITIYEAGQAVWTSPAEWRVMDLALGDPNDDGRGELLLAIRRPDGAGVERSQPYIVGYRGGRFGLMWGGRPVRDPILEVELGDVDGDLAQELVVIEERFDGSGRAVTVWDWQGWTFSLAWRSRLGSYSDLVLVAGADGRLDVSVAINHE
jgi:poly-gamma-glutamate synthesis protein (capsule biosynthesis protein)